MAHYSISSGSTSMTIDPTAGGRIISFKLDDYEFLTGKNIHPENYGSTFWSSPQSYWNWPPPRVLDKDAYFVKRCNNSVELFSGKDPVTGFQFLKKFSGGKNGLMNLTYSIINTADETKKVAPWEITRVYKGGLLFFPIGEKSMGVKHFNPVKTDLIDGVVWYKDEKERPEQHELSIADGSEGWAAYTIDGKLFIKKFHDVKLEMQAPGEAEVLLYISPEANYIEFEIQGKYEIIDQRQKSTWNIKWISVDIPSNIEIVKGSKDLVKFVREFVR